MYLQEYGDFDSLIYWNIVNGQMRPVEIQSSKTMKINCVIIRFTKNWEVIILMRRWFIGEYEKTTTTINVHIQKKVSNFIKKTWKTTTTINVLIQEKVSVSFTY